MKNFFQKNKIPVISMLIVFAFLLLFMIVVGIEPFGTNSFVTSDGLQYIYPLLMTFREKLVSGDGLRYYWNGALGDGFLPTYFYILSSPINFLVVLVNKYQVRSFINFTIVLRIVLSAGTFGFYLSKKHNDKDSAVCMIPLACAYALSGFIIGYYNENMWLDSYMLLPVIMYGYDRMIKDRKPLVYILSLVLSAFCNFYMIYMTGIFIVIWFLLDEHKSLKDFGRNLLTFGLNSLLAIGMAAFSLLVTMFALMDTRVSESDVIFHEWYGSIFNIIKNHFFLSTPVMINYSNNYANVYSGVFALVLVLMYFCSDKIKLSEKIRRGAMLLFLLVSMNESILSYILQGFHRQVGVPNRFSFLYIFVILEMASSAFKRSDKAGRSVIALVAAELLPMVTFVFVSLEGLYSDGIVLIVNLILIIVYASFVLAWMKLDNKKVLIILSAFMVCEIAVHSFVALKTTIYNAANYDYILESYDKYREENEKDDQFYRSILLNGLNENDNMLYDLKGVSVFNGFLDKNTRNFMTAMGYHSTDNVLNEKGGFYPVINDLLGIKEVGSAKDTLLNGLDYEPAYLDNNVHIYKNDAALSLGFGINPTDGELLLDNPSCFDNVNQLLTDMSGCETVVQEIYPEYSVSGDGFEVVAGDADNLNLSCSPQTGANGAYIKASFVATQAGKYNMSIYYQNYANIYVLINDTIRRLEYLQGGAVLTLGNILENDRVDIIMEPVDQASLGLQSLSSQILDIHMSVINDDNYQVFKDVVGRNQMRTRYIKADKLTADVHLDNDQVLFTSIPYNEGWHVYENGIEIEKKKYANTFIMLDIGEGDHSLEFRFIPKGFYLSIVLTGISWMIFAIYMIILKRRDAGEDCKADA